MDEPTKILLVEDNAQIAQSIENMLKQALPDVSIIVAHDGNQALNILFWQDDHTLPHLIILDLSVPQTSGLEVLRQIKKDPTTQDIPVIVLSSFAAENTMVQCYSWGAASFLRKPIKIEELVSALKHCLAAGI